MRQILVIDDDLMMRREICRALSNQGYQITEAPTPEEGITKAKSVQPDVILCDVVMPGMDGITVLRKLREDSETAAIPVIMVTSLDAQNQIDACLEEGAVDHITKPFSHKKLSSVVATILFKNRMNAMDWGRDEPASRSRSTRTVGFVGAKGGVGTTTVALNLASLLSVNQEEVVLCELRSTRGSLSSQLDTTPGDHLGTLCAAMTAAPSTTWERALVRDLTGLRIMFGPQAADQDLALNSMNATQIISELQPLTDVLMLDLSNGLSDLNMGALQRCDQIVIVVDCEPTSLKSAKLLVDSLERIAVRSALKAIGVRRTPMSCSLKSAEVERIIGCDLIGVVPPAADAIAKAVDKGTTLVSSDPDGFATGVLAEISETMFASYRSHELVG